MRICFRKFLFLAALLWHVLPSLGRANTYYVATNGNDDWSGTAPAYVNGKVGPWQSFAHILVGHTPRLFPGDTLYVRGGVYDHRDDGLASSLRLIYLYGTPARPIVVTNYPGEWPVILGSGKDNGAIELVRSSWVKVFGINCTNAYRGVCCQLATNCEIAYCDFGGGDPHYGYLCPFTMYANSQHNWVHHCTVHDSPAAPDHDSTHCMTFGMFYATDDFTSYNIIENNLCYHSGHDTLSCYSPSNLLRYNFVHNEPWYFRTDLHEWAGARDMEIGGKIGNYNWVLNNRLNHAGHTRSGGVGLEVSDGIGNLIRGNLFACNDYAGLVIYGGKVGAGPYDSDWGWNHVAHNTFLGNGFSQRFWTNFLPTPPQISPLDNYKHALMLVHTRNNAFVNNLLSRNFDNSPVKLDGSRNVSLWEANLTTRDAGLADAADGGPYSGTSPSPVLAAGSPAIDAGTWLARITSPSGQGQSIAVDDAGWFFAGLTAAGHAVPGDMIQLKGRRERARIVEITGNTIVVDRPLQWTTGEGVALAYAGAAPDAGAYEFGLDPGHL